MRRLNHFSWTFALSLWIFFFVFKEDLIYSFLYSFFTASISWLPDIDITFIKKINKLNRNTFFLLFPLTLFFKLIFRHRSYTHSFWAPLALLYYTEYYLPESSLKYLLRMIYLAVMLHIFEDTLTVSGVDIFYPISFKVRFMSFSTESHFHFHLLESFAYTIVFVFISYLFYLSF